MVMSPLREWEGYLRYSGKEYVLPSPLLEARHIYYWFGSVKTRAVGLEDALLPANPQDAGARCDPGGYRMLFSHSKNLHSFLLNVFLYPLGSQHAPASSRASILPGVDLR
jgi:hypothetical protein